MASRTFTEEVNFDGTAVIMTVNKLSHGIKPELKNYFGTFGLEKETGAFDDMDIPLGTIETIVIKRGLAALTIGGQPVPLNSPNPVDDFPEDFGLGEKPGEKDLYEEVLKAIVKHNQLLLNGQPALVFAQYAPEDWSPVNPTSVENQEKTAATPTVTRISGSSSSDKEG